MSDFEENCFILDDCKESHMERKIPEMRAKLLGIISRQKKIDASLQLVINHIERCQSKLQDYCSKRKFNMAKGKNQTVEIILRQIRQLDLLGADDTYSKSLETQNDSDGDYSYGQDLTLESLMKVNNFDLDQMMEDLFEADAKALADEATAKCTNGDTARRNVTI